MSTSSSTSRIRSIITEEKSSWWGYFYPKLSYWSANGVHISKMVYSLARHVGWFVVTTGMITALPLIFEVKREAAIEQMERMQIDQGFAEGKTPSELAQAGLSSAIEPKVLS